MKKWKARITAILIALLIAAAVVIFRVILSGRVTSLEAFREYMKGFGAFAPIALTLFQAFQVIIPVFPGALGYAAGTLMFGVTGGFFCNYIGISLGSVIAFFLARKFGIDIVLLMFSSETYEKWRGRIERSRYYDLLLILAILLPLFPDDFFCYFSGLMKMDPGKFIRIIILAKPWCILAYSIVIGLV